MNFIVCFKNVILLKTKFDLCKQFINTFSNIAKAVLCLLFFRSNIKFTFFSKQILLVFNFTKKNFKYFRKTLVLS